MKKALWFGAGILVALAAIGIAYYYLAGPSWGGHG